MNIRFLDADNIELLVKLRNDYFKADLRPVQNEVMDKNIRTYFEKYLNEDCYVVVAQQGQTIVSCAMLSIVHRPARLASLTGRNGIILNVFTYPTYRRQGYAKLVVDALVQKGKELELDYIDLLATKDGEQLYKKLGFEENYSDCKPMRMIIEK